MTEINQNDCFYVNNVHNIQFTLTDKSLSPVGPLDLTSLILRWTLCPINIDGSIGSPLLTKDSSTIGGVVINADPTTGIAVVRIAAPDTKGKQGKYYQQLEAIDNIAEPIVVSTGQVTLLINSDNL